MGRCIFLVLLLLASLTAQGFALTFEANRGQTDAEVEFVSRGSGYALFLTRAEAVFRLQRDAATPAVVRIQPVGTSFDKPLYGTNPLEFRSHYFLGSDRERWSTSVPHFGRVEYRELYPGISWIFRNSRKQDSALEYDFVVAPGADPGRIALSFRGVDKLTLAEDGALILDTPAGELRQSAPLIFQDIDGERTGIAGGYRVDAEGRVRFQVAAYDASRPLVIDPELVYSTYIGGSGDDDGDDDAGLAIDANQNTYLVGTTESLDFSGAGNAPAGGFDVVVAKIAADGSSILYATYIGGSGDEIGRSVTVDSFGNAYVTGETFSTDFPTVGAVQPGFGGGLSDAFVLKLDSTGSVLLYSSYFGGNGEDAGKSVAPDATGAAFLLGDTDSTDLATVNAFQPTYGGGPADAFAVKLDATGSTVLFATYIGGSGGETAREISVDGSGNGWFGGFTNSPAGFPIANAFQPVYGGGIDDGFLTGLSPTGVLFYSTYIGGSGIDVVTGVDHDDFGNIYLAGDTSSLNFPTLNAFQPSFAGGFFDTWLAKLDPSGTSLIYSTYFGSPGAESAHHLVVDGSGNAYPFGHSGHPGFPLLDPIQASYGGGSDDIIAAKFDPAGNLVYSTYLGGNGADRGNAVDVLPGGGDIFFTSDSTSTDFPVLNALQSFNAGGLDLTVSRITEPGPEIEARLVDVLGTTRFQVDLSNGDDESRQVELKVWLDTPEQGLLLSLLGVPTPVFTLPANLPSIQVIDFAVPGTIPFPGTRAGARMVQAENGSVLSESICTTVPCN